MEFRGSEILDRPSHLQIRLGQSPEQVADDLLGTRLTRKRRCKAELDGRVLASTVTKQYPASPVENEVGRETPDIKSISSAPSGPIPPPLKHAVLSGEEEERDPPPLRRPSTKLRIGKIRRILLRPIRPKLTWRNKLWT